MSYKRRKHAFTLAEVMIVLLVLTLLLAVFAPFITKRKTTKKGEDLWHWATRNYLAGPMDAFYNPELEGNNSLFIGITPDSKAEINDLYQPVGKLVIRSGFIESDLQRQIHFRHGRNSFEDIGRFAGTLLADNANLLLGAKFEHMVQKVSDRSYPANNIAIGFEALNQIGDRGVNTNPALNNIAIGHRAAIKLVEADNNVAIGANAGSINITTSNNTMVGVDAGIKAIKTDNTNIGYKSSSGNGTSNVLIGAGAGQQTNDPIANYEYNTAIGYKALSSITSGKYNTAIGAGALRNLKAGQNNVAIGYNACIGLINESNKTCIGYKSGPAYGSGASAELGMGVDDNAIRTYIGPNPNFTFNDSEDTEGYMGEWSAINKNYGGDAILEIHNIGGTNADLINNPDVKSNTTTIVNGNLVVFGKTYLTVGNILYPFSYESNLFGANYNEPCSADQSSYAFNIAGNCSNLFNLTGVSDRRLKNIGSKYNAGLDEINKINVYNYKFKADKNKHVHTGVLAQELQKIFPNAVFEGENGYLKIRWDEMFFASINAIKELNNKLTSLIKRATNLEANIEKLEKENKDLQLKADNLAKRVEALKSHR